MNTVNKIVEAVGAYTRKYPLTRQEVEHMVEVMAQQFARDEWEKTVFQVMKKIEPKNIEL